MREAAEAAETVLDGGSGRKRKEEMKIILAIVNDVSIFSSRVIVRCFFTMTLMSLLKFEKNPLAFEVFIRINNMAAPKPLNFILF